jgi:hypothetical protein
MHALRYKPSAAFRLDDTTPVQDFSGYDNVATTSGTILKGLALTADATYSVVYDADSFLTINVPNIYKRYKEEYSWTICAVVSATTPGQNQILSKGAAYDGLSINGTVVSFGTVYDTTGSATCSYDLQLLRKANLVGVHTPEKNSLYVNGELVAEVDITPEQQADVFNPGTNEWTSGGGTGVFLANNYFFFSRALRAEEVLAMYLADNRRPEGAAAKMFGGTVIQLGQNTRPAYLDTGFFTDEDWDQGEHYQTEAENGTLYAAKIDDLTLAGTWTGSVTVWRGETAVPINAINMFWSGKNATVEVSKDGTTWTAVTRGIKVGIYSANQTPTSDSMFIRVTFPAGQEDAWIENLEVVGYTGTAAIEWGPDMSITYPTQAVLFSDDYQAGDMRDDWGVSLRGGILSLSNADATQNPKTVEVVWKRGAAVTLSANLAAADTVYSNGIVAGDRANEWVIKHYTSAAGFSGALTFTGNVTIGHIALYDTVLSVDEIAKVIETYTGYHKESTSDGVIAIAESPAAWTPYGHDWEILSA